MTRCLPAAPAAAQLAEVEAGADAPKPATTSKAAAGLPIVPPAPIVAAVLGTVVYTAPAPLLEVSAEPGTTRVELAIARGMQGEGLAVPVPAVNATLDALSGAASVTLYVLTEVPGSEPGMGSGAQAKLAAQIKGTQPLPFEQLVRRALECRFDLCQFEFATQPWRLDRATSRLLRLPALLAVGALVVAIIGANVEWLMVAHQRDAINTQMTELLLNTFPKTTVVLDAPDQMSRQMQQLRVAAGELSPDDFLSMAVGLARSLRPVPVNGIAALDYHDRSLDVTFKPEIKVDAGLAKRLAASGLPRAIDSNTGKWTMRSGQ